jgi:AcrR family transcriptional regulator
MATERRTGPKGAETRARLLDIAERLMLDEGYAAVTTRRVAGIAGVNPALVHYYFPVTDDLFLALFRHGAERALERQSADAESAQPLRAMWSQWLDPRGTGLVMEFAALANHRKAVQAELAAYGRRHRALQIKAVARVFAEYGVEPDEMTPDRLVLLMTAVSRMLVVEDSVGLSEGHAAARALVEDFLDRYEPRPRAKRRVSASRRRPTGTR